MVNAQSQTPAGSIAIGDSRYYVGLQAEEIMLRLTAPQSVRIIDSRNNRTLSTLRVHSEDLEMQGYSLFLGQSVQTSENGFLGYEVGFVLPGQIFESYIFATETCERPSELYVFSGTVDGGELGQAWWGRVRGGFTGKASSFYGFVGLGSYEIDVEGASSVRTNCGAVVSAPSVTVSDTSFEFGFGVNLLLGNQFLLRTEATFFDFDVYSGARFGLGAGMRF